MGQDKLLLLNGVCGWGGEGRRWGLLLVGVGLRPCHLGKEEHCPSQEEPTRSEERL